MWALPNLCIFLVCHDAGVNSAHAARRRLPCGRPLRGEAEEANPTGRVLFEGLPGREIEIGTIQIDVPSRVPPRKEAAAPVHRTILRDPSRALAAKEEGLGLFCGGPHSGNAECFAAHGGIRLYNDCTVRAKR